MVDVKRPDKVETSARQFAMTREVCQDVGWRYEVFTGLPEPRLFNLTFLCGFGQDHYSPGPKNASSLLEAFTPGTPLDAYVRHVVRATGWSRAVVHGNVLHLLWQSISTPLLHLSLSVKFINYDSDSSQAIAQDCTRLALKSLRTNRVRHVGVAELLADDSYEPDAPDCLPVLDDVAVLEKLDDHT